MPINGGFSDLLQDNLPPPTISLFRTQELSLWEDLGSMAFAVVDSSAGLIGEEASPL